MEFDFDVNKQREDVIIEARMPIEDDPAMQLDEGWHAGHFCDWEVLHDQPIYEDKRGDKIILFWDIAGIRVRRRVNYTSGPRANLKILICGMHGISPEEPFKIDLRSEIGRHCEVWIDHNEKDGRWYTNVIKTRPYKPDKVNKEGKKAQK